MFKVFIYSFAFFYVFGNKSIAQSLPAKKELMAKMMLADKFYQKNIANSNSNQVLTPEYLDGLLALNTLKYNKSRLQKAIYYGNNLNWKIKGNYENFDIVDMANGKLFASLYQKEPSQTIRIANLKVVLDSVATGNKITYMENINVFRNIMPLMRQMSQISNDDIYFEKLYQMYIYSKSVEGLYSEQDFLWHTSKEFKPPFKTPQNQNCFWAYGNGCVIAGIAQLLDGLPQNSPHYEEYLDTFREMMIGLSNLQGKDGLWENNLLEPTYYGNNKLIGTALITYGMAWGVRKGLIDAENYTPIISKAINAIIKNGLKPNGKLNIDENKLAPNTLELSPNLFDAINSYENNLGAFLLAGSEVVKLIDKVK